MLNAYCHLSLLTDHWYLSLLTNHCHLSGATNEKLSQLGNTPTNLHQPIMVYLNLTNHCQLFSNPFVTSHLWVVLLQLDVLASLVVNHPDVAAVSLVCLE